MLWKWNDVRDFNAGEIVRDNDEGLRRRVDEDALIHRGLRCQQIFTRWKLDFEFAVGIAYLLRDLRSATHVLHGDNCAGKRLDDRGRRWKRTADQLLQCYAADPGRSSRPIMTAACNATQQQQEKNG